MLSAVSLSPQYTVLKFSASEIYSLSTKLSPPTCTSFHFYT